MLLILSLAACGMKGPLVLPPGPAPAPLLGAPKPAAKDVSTPAGAATPAAGTQPLGTSGAPADAPASASATSPTRSLAPTPTR